MSKPRDTTVLTVRVPNELIPTIKKRLAEKGWSMSAWLNWAIAERLRNHHKKR